MVSTTKNGSKLRLCVLCGKETPTPARGLCAVCYSVERRRGNIEKYPKVMNRPDKEHAACLVCDEVVYIVARGMCGNCYNRWYHRQPERKKKRAVKDRERRINNPELYRARSKKWYSSERGRRYQKEYRRKYYNKNRERVREYHRQWRQNHSEAVALYQSRSAAKRGSTGGHTTAEQRLKIIDYYCPDCCCLCCGELFDKNDPCRRMTMDHVVPLNNGGDNWPSNLQPICQSCNSTKRIDDTDYRPDGGEFARSLMS